MMIPGMAESRLQFTADRGDRGRPCWWALLLWLGQWFACYQGQVARLHPPTLSMMTIARGLANIITDGRQIVGYPDWFDSFATFRYFGFLSLTVTLAIVLVIAQLDFLALPRGRAAGLYAIGGSAEVARLAGIRV